MKSPEFWIQTGSRILDESMGLRTFRPHILDKTGKENIMKGKGKKPRILDNYWCVSVFGVLFRFVQPNLMKIYLCPNLHCQYEIVNFLVIFEFNEDFSILSNDL